MNNASDELIEVGKIVAPHGVRGDLRILPNTERPEIFKKLKRLFLGGKSVRLLSARPHKNIYILHIEGTDDRNGAELLVGKTVSVPRSEFPEPPDGTHYYFELIGLAAVTEDGSPVGTVAEIIQTGANDVYVIRPAEGKDILLPAIPDCVLSVDPAAGRMIVRLQEWDD